MKINTTSYRKIWFTSDWHLGHNKDFLYEPRGRTSRDDHVAWLITQINKLAKPDDLILHLGDMSLTSTYEEFLSWLREIRCKNLMCLTGNHEANFTKLKNRFYELANFNNPPIPSEDESYLLNNKKIKWLGQYREITIIEAAEEKNKKARRVPITLCHFPMLVWNKSHHGSINLCGHSHGSLIQSDPFYEEAKRLDCGIENALKWSKGSRVMFSWEDIKEIMSKKKIEILDHHNKETT